MLFRSTAVWNHPALIKLSAQDKSLLEKQHVARVLTTDSVFVTPQWRTDQHIPWNDILTALALKLLDESGIDVLISCESPTQIFYKESNRRWANKVTQYWVDALWPLSNLSYVKEHSV